MTFAQINIIVAVTFQNNLYKFNTLKILNILFYFLKIPAVK